MPLGVGQGRVDAARLPRTTPEIRAAHGLPAQNPPPRAADLRSYERAASPSRFCNSAMRAVMVKPRRVLTASMCVFDSALNV